MIKHRTATGYTNEAQTIARLVTFLNERGCRVWRHPNTGTFNPDKVTEAILSMYEAVKTNAINKQAFLQGLQRAMQLGWGPTLCQIKGTWDIVGFDSFGKILAIEVKFGKDDLSPEQVIFRDEVQSVGGHCYIVRDFDVFSQNWYQYEQRHRPNGRPGLPSFKASRGKAQTNTLFQ